MPQPSSVRGRVAPDSGLSERPVAESLHLLLVSLDHPVDLRLAEGGTPLPSLANPEELLRLVGALTEALRIFLRTQALEGRALDRPFQPIARRIEAEEAGGPGEGHDRLLQHVLVADDVQPGAWL